MSTRTKLDISYGSLGLLLVIIGVFTTPLVAAVGAGLLAAAVFAALGWLWRR